MMEFIIIYLLAIIFVAMPLQVAYVGIKKFVNKKSNNFNNGVLKNEQEYL